MSLGCKPWYFYARILDVLKPANGWECFLRCQGIDFWLWIVLNSPLSQNLNLTFCQKFWVCFGLFTTATLVLLIWNCSIHIRERIRSIKLHHILRNNEKVIWFALCMISSQNKLQSNLFQSKWILHELVIMLAVHGLKRCTKNPWFDLISLFYHLIWFILI